MPARPRLAALALLVLPAAAQAECAGETFIACDPAPGRHLEVCIEPGAAPGEGAFTYAYGPPGAPDLTLREPFSAGTATPWNGVGREIWASVAFRNGAYAYEAWHSLDRLEENAPLQAGVNVLKDGELIASLTCPAGPGTTIAPLFTIEDAMQAAGWRRDRDRREWRREDGE